MTTAWAQLDQAVLQYIAKFTQANFGKLEWKLSDTFKPRQRWRGSVAVAFHQPHAVL